VRSRVQSPWDAFSLARLVVGAAVLIFAARSDLLTRRVGDWCWWLFLAAGLVILEAQLVSEGQSFLFLLAPFYLIVVFLSLWYEGEVMGDHVKRRDSAVVAAILNIGAFVVFGAQLGLGADPSTADGMRHIQLLTIPVMILVDYLLYRTQLLSGGADAKAFLSLAVLVPFYPGPILAVMEPSNIFLVICPFVLAVFFSAAFFTLFNPVGLFFYNLARGDTGRLMAFAYRLPIPEARARRFVWLSESVGDGARVHHYFRFRDQTRKWKREQLDLLEKEGEKKVWVQPQIPFMVQLAAGFIFTFVLGNIILYGIVRLLAGL
jgi:hypothetical protein